MTQPARLAVVGLGLLFGAGAEWLRIQSGWPLSWVVGDATPGALFFVAGLLAWGRRSGSPIGPLMIAAGFAWFVGTYGASRNPVIDRLGVGFQGWYDFLIAALILVYPTGRLVGMAPRVVLVAFGILIAIRSAFRFAYSRASTDYDLRDPAAVDQFVSDRTIRDTTEVLFRYGLTVVALLILAVVIRRLVRDTAAARRVAGPILVAGIGFAVAILVEVGAIALADSSDERLAVWDTAQLLTVVSAGAIPIALLFGLTRDRLARGSVADLVVQLGDGPERPGLRDVLARALQDPSLEIAYPAPGPELDRYVDAEGQPMAVPDAARTDRATTRLEASGRTIAVLIHDPAVGEQRELVGSVAAATRLALENERLTAEVRTQLDEVRASRARIVAAGDAERRRVERDLHDGAQQRLVTLALSLQMARESVNGADPALAATLGRATAELEQALAELRELARGLHPTILTEDGLGAAVQALADRSSVPVRVAVRTGRHTPGVEAAAYFVVAESLTNVAKYAAATGAEVRVNEVAGLLIVEVADDGVGGADPGGGSGLRGLEDRVSAAGGTLTLRSDPGRGTTVRAEIPCG